MDALGDDQVIVAKARAAGPLSPQARRVLEPTVKPSPQAENGTSIIHNGAPPPQRQQSWRDAARAVFIEHHAAQPKIREFERSVLPSLRTLRAQFLCDVCTHCRRPVIRSLFPEHVAECATRDRSAKQTNSANGNVRRLKTEDPESFASTPEPEAAVASATARTKRKRRGADDDEPAPKKAKATASAEKAAAPAKPKQPRQLKQPKEKALPVYNPDKHCGVPLPSSQPCMRSLTCKAHSMAQKRAVTGRSVSFDKLLANYQRMHHSRQQQPLSDVQAAEAESDQRLEEQAQLNPEREVQQVMEGMSRVFCPPLDRKVVVATQARSKNFRLREMLALALLPRRLATTGDAIFGRSLAFRPATPDVLNPVHAPAVQQAVLMAHAHQAKMQQMQQQEQAQAQAQLQARIQAQAHAHANNKSQPAAVKQQEQAQPQAQAQTQAQAQAQAQARVQAQARAHAKTKTQPAALQQGRAGPEDRKTGK